LRTRSGTAERRPCSSRSRSDATRAISSSRCSYVVASATALAEVVPDASLRPAGFSVSIGEELELVAIAAPWRRRRPNPRAPVDSGH